ncbi:heat shock factor protein 4-like, partial [Scleropages formosus]
VCADAGPAGGMRGADMAGRRGQREPHSPAEQPGGHGHGLGEEPPPPAEQRQCRTRSPRTPPARRSTVAGMQESPGSLGVDGSYASNVPAFLTKLWTLVEDPETSHLICWSASGTSFHVFDQGRFAKEVLPKYFKHNNMASFVRQLNMYGFRKVVNIEQSGLVSVVKSEETKVRQEDLSKLLYEVQVLRNQQENMECQMQDMKHQNEVLWREVVSLRQNHTQQQKVMNKLIQFLFSQMQSNTSSSVAMKRKLPLMLDDGSTSPPVSNLPVEPMHEPYFIQSPSAEATHCSSSNVLAGGPIISDVTEMSQSGSMGMPTQGEDSREKCLMLIKEEPVSPGVQGPGEGMPLGSCQAFAEPPILPVAMVQSVLEGRGSGAGERRSKRVLERSDIPDNVENVDMSLEDLQLLLRNHQQGIEPATAMDVSTAKRPCCQSQRNFPYPDPATRGDVTIDSSLPKQPFNAGLPLSEWNFTDIEANLKSRCFAFLFVIAALQYMFQHQDPDVFGNAGCEEQ